MKMFINNIGERSSGTLDLPRVFKQMNSSDAGLVADLIDEIECLQNDIFVIEKNIEISMASFGAIEHDETYNHLGLVNHLHNKQIIQHQNRIRQYDSIIDSTVVP